MIDISVDESYAFDMLSILLVKFNKTNGESELANYSNMAQKIKGQVGEERYRTVLQSIEFESLWEENQKIFDLVDRVKKECKGDDLAYRVDSSNFARYVIKKDLQRKFFNSEVKETKHGY